MRLKPNLISIAPNNSLKDALLALSLLFLPSKINRGSALDRLQSRLAGLTEKRFTYLFNSARNSLLIGLKSLDLKPGDQVICQALTCVAVPNSIIFSGAQPVYCDVLKNGVNLDPKDLQKKITSKTKAVIIQHNFGFSDQLKIIQQLCRTHHITLIEDCAHSLGGQYQGKSLGSFGDLTVLSFGRDKMISSTFGGALLTNNPALAKKIDSLYQSIPSPKISWTLRQLLHPLIMALAVPSYYWLSFGKALIFLSIKLHLIDKPVTNSECSARPGLLIKRLPNALARLVLLQLDQLDRFNRHRQQLSQLYFKYLNQKLIPNVTRQPQPLLRFPVLVDQPQSIINRFKSQHILLGNWYRPVIAPAAVSLPAVGFKKGDCPQAVAVSKKIINLPTHRHTTSAQAKAIINQLNHYVSD